MKEHWTVLLKLSMETGTTTSHPHTLKQKQTRGGKIWTQDMWQDLKSETLQEKLLEL